jgi:hypothetical protein
MKNLNTIIFWLLDMAIINLYLVLKNRNKILIKRF